MNVEQKLEQIRSRWGRENYGPGIQASGNYIDQKDALEMINIMEHFSVPLRGFEAFTIDKDGAVTMMIDMEEGYYEERVLDEAPHAHAKRLICEYEKDAVTYYYQIYYDANIARSITYDLSSEPT